MSESEKYAEYSRWSQSDEAMSLFGSIGHRLKESLYLFWLSGRDAGFAAGYEAATAAERERAAGIADNYGRDPTLSKAYACETADEIAAAIREGER